MTGSRATADDVRSNLVVSARVTPMPERLGDPLPGVWVTCQDGTETRVFDFFPDEISFSGDDFVGLTTEECRLLKFGRDRAFLQH